MFFKKKPKETPLDRLVDEQVYAQVLEEIESGQKRGGLWLKAIHESGGDEQRAKILYIGYRVQAIKDEAVVERATDVITRAQANERLNGYDENGRTPLMRAVLVADLDAVKQLLASGADPRIKDNTFGTSTAADLAVRELSTAESEMRRTRLRQIFDALDTWAAPN